jgi:hypothetical protein
MTKRSFYKFICIFIFLIFPNTHADEFGISLGINSSFYPPGCGCAESANTDDNYRRNRAEYQITDYLNPFGCFYVKSFTKHFGLYSALQISKMSNLEEMPKFEFDSSLNGKVMVGNIYPEKIRNYVSIELSPRIAYKFNCVTVDARAGLCGNAYINEKILTSGNDSPSRSDYMRPFVLSLICGIGTGYTIRNSIVVGVKSSVSKTDTNLYKQYGENYYFLNWHNVLYASINL